MALTVGTRLGHYDVTALLGEGDMGWTHQIPFPRTRRSNPWRIEASGWFMRTIRSR